MTQIQQWGSKGGRPARLDRMALARLQKLCAAGKSQGGCAKEIGLSSRTIGGAVARMQDE